MHNLYSLSVLLTYKNATNALHTSQWQILISEVTLSYVLSKKNS